METITNDDLAWKIDLLNVLTMSIRGVAVCDVLWDF